MGPAFLLIPVPIRARDKPQASGYSPARFSPAPKERLMAGSAEKTLAEKKIELPKAAAPVANYVPVVMAGNLAFVSGQVTVWNGEFKFIGRLGKEYTIEQGQQAARICGLNVLAQLRAALGGSLDRVKRCVKLGVFVNSVETFTDQPKVANGVSDLMVEVFGDAGKHARFAVGTNVLPLNVAVEVDAVFEIA
jgi:enamine deaminase RidA (YjgF/YER057c/UK114 family)